VSRSVLASILGVSPIETEMGSVTFTVGEDVSKLDRSIGAEVLLDEIPEGKTRAMSLVSLLSSSRLCVFRGENHH
jgi:hypothetical protein